MASVNVFLSYRREDSEGYAGRFYDRLCARFPNRIFRDVKDLEPGVDFVDEIGRKLQSCAVMITLIGPRWLSATDAAGHRRLDQPDDLHRLEIATALRRNVRVIPALVGGASMPSSDDLPKDLVFLARRQALPISEIDFDHDMERLFRVLEKELVEAGDELIAPRNGVSPLDRRPPPPATGALANARHLHWSFAVVGLSVVLLIIIVLSRRTPTDNTPKDETRFAAQPSETHSSQDPPERDGLSDYFTRVDEELKKPFEAQQHAAGSNMPAPAQPMVPLTPEQVESFGKTASVSEPQLAKLLQEGESYLAQRRYQEALNAYERVVPFQPKNARATAGMAWAMAGLQRRPESNRLWSSAVDADPASVETLGDALASKGDQAGAKTLWKKLAESAPSYAQRSGLAAKLK